MLACLPLMSSGLLLSELAHAVLKVLTMPCTHLLACGHGSPLVTIGALDLHQASSALFV